MFSRSWHSLRATPDLGARSIARVRPPLFNGHAIATPLTCYRHSSRSKSARRRRQAERDSLSYDPDRKAETEIRAKYSPPWPIQGYETHRDWPAYNLDRDAEREIRARYPPPRPIQGRERPTDWPAYDPDREAEREICARYLPPRPVQGCERPIDSPVYNPYREEEAEIRAKYPPPPIEGLETETDRPVYHADRYAEDARGNQYPFQKARDAWAEALRYKESRKGRPEEEPYLPFPDAMESIAKNTVSVKVITEILAMGENIGPRTTSKTWKEPFYNYMKTTAAPNNWVAFCRWKDDIYNRKRRLPREFRNSKRRRLVLPEFDWDRFTHPVPEGKDMDMMNRLAEAMDVVYDHHGATPENVSYAITHMDELKTVIHAVNHAITIQERVQKLGLSHDEALELGTLSHIVNQAKKGVEREMKDLYIAAELLQKHLKPVEDRIAELEGHKPPAEHIDYPPAEHTEYPPAEHLEYQEW